MRGNVEVPFGAEGREVILLGRQSSLLLAAAPIAAGAKGPCGRSVGGQKGRTVSGGVQGLLDPGKARDRVAREHEVVDDPGSEGDLAANQGLSAVGRCHDIDDADLGGLDVLASALAAVAGVREAR